MATTIEPILDSFGATRTKRARSVQSWVVEIHGVSERSQKLAHRNTEFRYALSGGISLAERRRMQTFCVPPYYVGHQIFRTTDPKPQRLDDLLQAIRDSSWIADINDDWDGEEAVGYSKDTLARASHLLLDLAEASARLFQQVLPAPRISPADQGSIDLFWEIPFRQLLINVPRDASESASFYGESTNGESTSGVIQAGSKRSDVAAWLLGL